MGHQWRRREPYHQVRVRGRIPAGASVGGRYCRREVCHWVATQNLSPAHSLPIGAHLRCATMRQPASSSLPYFPTRASSEYLQASTYSLGLDYVEFLWDQGIARTTRYRPPIRALAENYKRFRNFDSLGQRGNDFQAEDHVSYLLLSLLISHTAPCASPSLRHLLYIISCTATSHLPPIS